MAIVYVRPANARPAEITFERRTYHRSFLVKTSADTDGPFVVSQAADPFTGVSIPAVGATYDDGIDEVDSFAWVARISPRLVDEQGHHQLWQVDVEYSSDVRGVGWYEWEWVEQDVKVPFVREIDAGANTKNVLTTAGEPFDPPPMRDDYVMVLRHVRTEATDPSSLAWVYRNTVNSAAFPGLAAPKPAGFPSSDPGYVLLKKYEIKPRRIAAGAYVYDVRREFWFNSKEKWTPRKILNAGYRAYKTANTPPAYELDDGTGRRGSKPRLIKADGTFDKNAQLPSDAYFAEFQDRGSSDFNDFNLIFNG